MREISEKTKNNMKMTINCKFRITMMDTIMNKIKITKLLTNMEIIKANILMMMDLKSHQMDFKREVACYLVLSKD